MKFSHLIQINDPLNPLIDPLSREQLWRGLVLRAENPLLFVMGLDRFEIVERRLRTRRHDRQRPGTSRPDAAGHRRTHQQSAR